MAAKDVDDWGDFNSSTLSHTLFLHKPTSAAHRDLAPAKPGSVPGRVNSVAMAQFQKSRGALPLSLFGDMEAEEEEEGEVERSSGGGPSLDKGANFFAYNNKVDYKKNKKDGSLGVNVDDLVAILYKKAERASDFIGSYRHTLGLDSGTKLHKEDMNMISNCNWMDQNLNNGNFVNEKKLDLDWNPLNLDRNGVVLRDRSWILA